MASSGRQGANCITAEGFTEASNSPTTYQNIYVGGTGPTQLGSSYYQGPSEEERNIQAILESLRYEGMDDRGKSLGQPGSRSYEWIFDSQNPHPAHFNIPTCHTREESWWLGESRAAGESLKAWLSSGTQPLFWITGKPRSGKSVLMKFLRYHWPTEDLLKAQGGSLIMAQHFFWIPGSTIRKTFTGMLRHLAHSVVETLWSQQSLEPSLFGRY